MKKTEWGTVTELSFQGILCEACRVSLSGLRLFGRYCTAVFSSLPVVHEACSTQREGPRRFVRAGEDELAKGLAPFPLFASSHTFKHTSGSQRIGS